MIIFPAIDLLDGKCVRLYQGDYNKSSQVAGDPVETAKRFLDDGAEYLHIVDLNGAKNGVSVNFPIIEKLALLGMKVQTGGGVRNMKRIKDSFSVGVDKIILGSAAVNDRDFLVEALNTYGEKIIVGVDALDGEVKTAGWIEGSGLNYLDFSKELEALGVKTIIFTDISRDGTLSGVNTEQLKALIDSVSIRIIASGGVRNIGDIDALIRLGAYGAICGKSIYSGTLSLKQAIERSKNAV